MFFSQVKQIVLSKMSLKPMFAAVAKRYDLLNHIITFGLDKVWREACCKKCTSGKVILDLCCGTGDLTIGISKNSASKTFILGLDFSKMMLQQAKTKIHSEGHIKSHNDVQQMKKGGWNSNVNFILADAAQIPFRDNSINRICTSFSFRNLIYGNQKAKLFLLEVLRTLHPQGKFVFVETSQPKSLFLRSLYHVYINKVVPILGWLISKNKGAYNYLGVSAANFPSAEKIADMLLSIGFRNVTFKHMTLGAVALHIGVK